MRLAPSTGSKPGPANNSPAIIGLCVRSWRRRIRSRGARRRHRPPAPRFRVPARSRARRELLEAREARHPRQAQQGRQPVRVITLLDGRQLPDMTIRMRDKVAPRRGRAGCCRHPSAGAPARQRPPWRVGPAPRAWRARWRRCRHQVRSVSMAARDETGLSPNAGKGRRRRQHRARGAPAPRCAVARPGELSPT